MNIEKVTLETEQAIEKPERLTRDEIIKRLEDGKSLEELNLVGLDLAGLELKDVKFNKSDVRGIRLYQREEKEDGTLVETTTNITGSDFTDATFADFDMTDFFKIDAENTTFGFTEDLAKRRKRHQETGERPKAEDTGGFFSFDGSKGNFKNSRWNNIDFGGGSGYEARFRGADLKYSIIARCDLSEIDFSEADINGIEVIDPLSLRGMRISEGQIETIKLIQDQIKVNEKDMKKVLIEHGVVVV